MYPANLAGVPDALIFFCFFSSIKGRKEGIDKKTPADEKPFLRASFQGYKSNKHTMTQAFNKTPVELTEHYGHILRALRRGVTITASADGRVNPMTISWGMIGIEWNRPLFITYVRTGRFTHGLLDRNPEFTVNLPAPDTDHPTRLVSYLGTHSGRNEDKIATLGLHLVPGSEVSVPGLAELPLTLECRILYRQLQQADCFLPGNEAILKSCYPQDVPSEATGSNRDFHTAIYGEIVGAHLIQPA